MPALHLSGTALTCIAGASALLFLTDPGLAATPENAQPVASVTAPYLLSAARPAVTYSPPDMTIVSSAQLKQFYQWRNKMDWLLAPIHTRADLKHYLKATAKSDSPLDALSPDERRRVLANIRFGPHGAFIANTSDLQYLSTEQVYKILALFGEQSMALEFTNGEIRPASPRVPPNTVKPSVIQKRFGKYLEATHPVNGGSWDKRSQRVARTYDHLFAPDQNPHFVKKVGSHDLRLLFRAASDAAFYTFDPEYARDAQMDFSEMEKRHFAGPPDYEQMYQTLVRTRRFAAAHEFYQKHPDVGLTPFPAYRDEAGSVGEGTPTMLVVNTTRDELIRRPVNLNKPVQVLILTDPECHFCAIFLHGLQSHPKLRKVLQEHALWVTPPGSELEFATLLQWNKTHPHQQLNIMYNLQGWPMVKVLATPQFFFLRNGKMVKHYMGWGKKAKFSELEADLKAIGLEK